MDGFFLSKGFEEMDLLSKTLQTHTLVPPLAAPCRHRCARRRELFPKYSEHILFVSKCFEQTKLGVPKNHHLTTDASYHASYYPCRAKRRNST